MLTLYWPSFRFKSPLFLISTGGIVSLFAAMYFYSRKSEAAAKKPADASGSKPKPKPKSTRVD